VDAARSAEGAAGGKRDFGEEWDLLTKIRQEILDLPRSLRETLEKGRPEYEAVVRQTRWRDGPVYLVGSGPSHAVALSGARAFEALLGWPALHHTPEAFEAYVLAALRPRSVLLLISPSGEEEGILSVAQAAESRGATVLALTTKPESPLARCAEGLLLVRRFDQQEAGLMSLVCQQAAVSYLALIAAQTLKRPQALQQVAAAEFGKLPDHVEWVLTQLADVARSWASELKEARALDLVGAGFYYPTALLAAFLLRKLTGIRAQAWEAGEFIAGGAERLERDSLVVCLSGSRCRLKKVVHQAAALAKTRGARIISVTDANDRELSARSAVSVLLPSLTEVAGAPLTSALLEWVIYQAARARAAGDAPGSPVNSRRGR
jgi:fructoselysine-6-P-deglycase FrlB-like protein